MYQKTDGTTINNAEDLDLVRPMCKLLEYSSNYSDTTSRLWLYSNGEATIFNNDIKNTEDFKSKAKLLGNTVAQPAPNQANGILKNATIALPLKCLNTFWRLLVIPFINCKFELKLRWTKHCILPLLGNRNDNADVDFNNIIFTTNDTKLYVPIVIFSAKDSQKLSKLLSKGFKRLVY